MPFKKCLTCSYLRMYVFAQKNSKLAVLTLVGLFYFLHLSLNAGTNNHPLMCAARKNISAHQIKYRVTISWRTNLFAWLCWKVITKWPTRAIRARWVLFYSRILGRYYAGVKFIREGHVIRWTQLLLPNGYRTLRDMLHYYSCFQLIL